MKRLLLLPGLALLTAITGFGQEPPDQLHHRPLPRPPIIWINPQQGPLKPVTLSSLNLEIQVHGHLASTTMEMTFSNPNGRVLEGELLFPLGEGQTVSGYALEVEGHLRQAVVVEKEKGREVFEEVERRRIDPGLAELTKGNVFRTRVYPIPANGTKRISVSFEQELADTDKGFRYFLPLGYPDKVEHFHARAEVIKQELAPIPDANGASLTFERWRDSFVAEVNQENVTLDKPLAFIAPKTPQRTEAFLVSDKLEPSHAYFAAHVQREFVLPEDRISRVPKHVAIFYDASGSANHRDRKRELDVIAQSLSHFKTHPLTVDIVAFRNDADKPVRFELKDGDFSPARKFIEELPLDGGTSLGAVDITQTPDADIAILVSDGLTNFGPSEPKLSGNGKSPRFIAIHAAQQVDAANLSRLARKFNGRVINLLTTQDDNALDLFDDYAFEYLGAKVISGKVEDLAPTLPEIVEKGFSIAGKCEGRSEIELSFGYQGQTLVTRRIVLDPAKSLPPDRGAFVRRVWAQKRITELTALDPKGNAAAITALGKENSIVTANTSLIVLDRIEDYAAHGIEPPEPELRDQYFALLARQPKKDKSEAEHLNQVEVAWKEFKAWHEKRQPWLETVLLPAAQHEAAAYEQLSQAGKGEQPKLKADDWATARELLDKAKSLNERWPKEGQEAESRSVWEKEAISVMLAVDQLRQKRLAAAPESDRGARGLSDTSGGVVRLHAESTTHRSRSLDRLEERAVAPPPSAATNAATPAESPAPGAAFDSSTTTATGRLDAAKKVAPSATPMSGSIEIKPWTPNAPYLKRLSKATDAYAAYLKERATNENSSAFFLDCADFFRDQKKDERIALRVLSNLAEMETENAPLLRILAYRLEQLGLYNLATPLFEEVLTMRGEEPQSRRDLALALARQDKPDYHRAVSLLWEVAKKTWDSRFPGIEIIALHEMNDILARAPQDQRPNPEELGIEPRFLANLPVDLRVVLTWDADLTDIDLWVTDPTGETCIYNHNRTATGGRMSNDFTRGYGPEVFTVRRALPGTYTVRVNFFGNTQQKLMGATTVQIEFQTAFGKADAKRQAITRRLKENKEMIEVGKFTFQPEVSGAE